MSFSVIRIKCLILRFFETIWSRNYVSLSFTFSTSVKETFKVDYELSRDIDVVCCSAKVHCLFRVAVLHRRILNLANRSSYIDVYSYLGKTKRGELSIFPKLFVVLSHCLHMMPKQKAAPASVNANVKVNEFSFQTFFWC